MTGMDIVRAIVAGERDPQKLATFRQKGCKHSEADFIKAMTGHYREEELFALKQELALYDSYTQYIRECNEQVERQFSVIKPIQDEDDLPPLGPSRKKGRSKNGPGYDARTALYRVTGVDLTDIDGLNESTLQTILSEIGTDMSKWPTVKHFCAWLGLAPKNDISGGKVLRSRTMKVKNRAAQALRLAAQSVAKTQTAIGAYYRRLCARKGPSQAIVATAHKLARIIYFMLKDHEAFRAMSAEEYDKSQRDRALKSLNRQARRLGYVVVPQT
jgi:transposase